MLSSKNALVIKFKNFQRVVTDTHKYVREAQLLLFASSLAYTTLLSIVPLLAVSFAIFQAFGGLEKLYQHMEPYLLEYLAEGNSQEVTQRVRQFISNIHGGALGASGFFALILTCLSMFQSVDTAINRVWKTTNQRPWFYRMTTYWFFITLGPLAFAVILGTLSSNSMSVPGFFPKGTAGFVLGLGLFYLIYRLVPNRNVHWSSALTSSIFTTTCLGVARLAYSFYTKTVLSYSKIYGGLAAIPILILWIYIVWVIVLLGAALGSALQKRLDA